VLPNIFPCAIPLEQAAEGYLLCQGQDAALKGEWITKYIHSGQIKICY
jgi:hypothetical protein